MLTIYDLDTPALLADLDRLERNIDDMAQVARAGGKALRPHTKTHKTPEIARMQMQAGAGGLTVAKLGEAETLAAAGFTDIFIANQIVGDFKITRLMNLIHRSHAKDLSIRVGVDSREIAEALGDEAKSRGLRVPVLMEVDTGLGRAGVRSQDEGALLARRLADHSGLEFLGIFTHEGHLYKGDNPAQGAQQAAEAMRSMAAILAGQGTPCEVVSVGSTPGAPLLAPESGLTELRPGVYVFYDRMQVQRGADPARCALTVLATVVSVRSDGKIILDAGTKSLASDCPFPDKTYGEIVDHPEVAFVGASEEHGHLQAQGETSLKIGDKVRILPNHACTCVNMHDTLTAFRKETIEAVWTIAGRGKIR